MVYVFYIYVAGALKNCSYKSNSFEHCIKRCFVFLDMLIWWDILLIFLVKIERMQRSKSERDAALNGSKEMRRQMAK